MGTRELSDEGIWAGCKCLALGVGLLVALATAGGFAPQARAEMPGSSSHNRSEAIWKRMDVCKRQAWKEHPDYTPEGNAKRDLAVKQCLEANNLPPVAPLTPEPPPVWSGSSR